MTDNGATIEHVVDLATCELPPMQTAEQFLAECEAELRPFVSKFGALFLDQLDDPGPEHEWLIDGILSIGDKSVIGGPSQSGKSFLAIHAGMCIAHGIDFFGMPVRKGLVVYQAGEGSRGVKKRLRAWRLHHGKMFSRETPFVLLQSRVDLYGKDGDTKPLIAEIKAIQQQYDLPLMMVVIDTLATAATGAEENSAKDMGMVIDNIGRINVELNVNVTLVHHMNEKGEKLRGSTAIFANIDQTIFVKRDPLTKVRTASLGKQRDDDADEVVWQFELKRITLGVNDSGREITSCVTLPVGEKEAIRRAEEQKGFLLKPKTEEVFMRAFFEAEKQYGQPVPEAFDLPPSIRSIVKYSYVKDVYKNIAPDDEPEAPAVAGETKEQAEKRKYEREKKRVQRLGKKLADVREPLTKFDVLGFGKHEEEWFCWWTGKVLRGFPETQPQAEAQRPWSAWSESNGDTDSGIEF